MKCSKCGADTFDNSTSSLCPTCLQAQQVRSRYSVLLIVSISAFVVFTIVLMLPSGTNKTASSNDSSAVTTSGPPASSAEPPQDAPAAVPTPARPDWTYDSYQTNAGSKTVQVGCIDSDEMVHLNSPYEDTYERLCLRTDGSAIIVLNGSGQLLSGEEHGAVIRVGEGPARRFSLVEPADYSTNEAFIEPAGPLFAAAKAGKPITIEATYYEAGNQATTFSPSGALKFK